MTRFSKPDANGAYKKDVIVTGILLFVKSSSFKLAQRAEAVGNRAFG